MAKKIVLFGDSIIGGYRNGLNTDILEKLIDKHLTNMTNFSDFEFMNMGINGETSRDGIHRIGEVVQENPDVIVIGFGTNDLIDEKVTEEEYLSNLTRFIDELGMNETILLTPAYINTPEVSTTILEGYVSVVKRIGKQMNVSVIDSYHHFMVYPAKEEFLSFDGIHLSEAGYDFLAALIAKNIKAKLSR